MHGEEYCGFHQRLWVLAAVAVLIVCCCYAVMLYKQLVNVKHAVSQAWANIDVLLRQRHDETTSW